MYKEMYYRLFNAITDAMKLISQERFGEAFSLLEMPSGPLRKSTSMERRHEAKGTCPWAGLRTPRSISQSFLLHLPSFSS